MDIRKVKKLIELLDESPNVGEIEVTEDKESVRISRNPSLGTHYQPMASHATYAPMPQAPNMQFSAEPTNASAPQQTQTTVQKSIETVNPKDKTITTPMVGTFYRSPNPADKPFVEEGKRVKIGDVLCIVEAMKMLNQIESEYAGTIKKVLVENGQPVEFGQGLFVITED
jgi:acetyl-CoA carboxylase biotin carboxyl carrier protein